ncbi:MAG: hypothetical protein JW874_02370 [Spirochaetales bacterium]|nr:hypothetical protein [Spirochaetales bacterium]
MKESEVFKRLTSSLSIQERKSLLEKIKIPDPPEDTIQQIDELTEKHELDIDTIYKKLSLFHKILVFLKVLFQKKNRDEIIETEMLHNVELKLERNSPEIVDIRQRLFLPRFYEEFRELEIYISRVKPTIIFAREKLRRDFLLFLGTFELEDFSRTIVDNTDPESLFEENTKDSISDLKKKIDKNLDEAFSFIYPDDKDRMYTHSRLFYNLCEFVSFPLESMLSFFNVSNGKAQPCLMKDIRKYFLDFIDHISSMKMFPADIVLEALFLFRTESLDEVKEENIVEEELKTFLLDMRNLVSSVNHIKKDLYLIDLARVISRRVNYQPGRISGGEDWFILFRSAWEERINVVFESFRRKKLVKQHIAEAVGFLGTPGLPTLDYYNKAVWAGYHEVHYGLCMGFLREFLQAMMPNDIMPVLKKILIDGEFYKEQNREELVNNLNLIIQCTERIRLLDRELSPKGDTGSDIDTFKKELSTENLRRKKIQARLEGADNKAEYIIRDFLKAGHIITKVLQGILSGQQEGSYDTLSNIGDLNRKNHRNMLPVIDALYMKMDTVMKIATNLFDIEREK